MMTLCPAGHETTATDYCDTCGAPLAPGAQPSPPAAVDVAPGTPEPSAATPDGKRECPSCHASNPGDALFCEACGYDFTTGVMPRSSVLTIGTPQWSDASRTGDAVEAREEEAVATVDADEHPFASGEANTTDSPEQADVGAPAQQPADDPETEASELTGWVAEVWIDPDWYAVQESTEQLPSPGLPHIVPLTGTSVLIGRPSRSRGIVPDIDCEPDSGCSRRQAQLTTDGRRWWVEDLGSSNGTYVGTAGGPLPDKPLDGRHELAPDDRVYVGAWTRIVVRPATGDEEGL